MKHETANAAKSQQPFAGLQPPRSLQIQFRARGSRVRLKVQDLSGPRKYVEQLRKSL